MLYILYIVRICLCFIRYYTNFKHILCFAVHPIDKMLEIRILRLIRFKCFFQESYGTSKPSLNPRDRLKKKMQILLNKQCEFLRVTRYSKNISAKIAVDET